MTREELEAIHYHWHVAIDQIEEGVIIVEGDFEAPSTLQIVYANRAFAGRLGFPIEDIVGRELECFVPNQPMIGLAKRWCAERKERFHGVFPLRAKDDDWVVAEWTISSRIGYANRVPDHTVTLNWQPRQATSSGVSDEHAFELSKADTISHIAKGVVHDFNNSLTAIRGHLEVALSELPYASEPQNKVLRALEATETTAELCRRLLTYARGQREEKRPCAVAELIQQAVSITSLGSSVTCKYHIGPNLWPILADGIQIVQVINNLLMNAQQAMPNGGVIVLAARNLSVSDDPSVGLPPGNYVAISVRDRGIGIPEELKARIFDSLFTTKSEGSGLGLSTCARIVSAHQGYIDVQSEPNYGSEFIVYLPAVHEVIGEESREVTFPWPVPEASANGPSSASRPVRTKILLIEDQEGVAQVAKMYLEKLGHEVAWADSGQVGVRLYRDTWGAGARFGVVIIDLTLPGGMSGQDAFRELQQIDPEVIGIATSGSFDEQSWPKFQALGFAAILPKPYPLQRLGEVVEEAMVCRLRLG